MGCVICMMDFVYGDIIRCLPCLHSYHVHCLDDWFLCSYSCPCCCEPVDPAWFYSCC